MSKDLKVLAECVDIRSGRRFRPGETFDPVPTEEQARRLVKAGVLPEGAIELGKKADADAEKKATAETKAREAAAQKQAAIATATENVVKANAAVRAAEGTLKAADTAEKKADADKALAAAKQGAKDAQAELEKLNK